MRVQFCHRQTISASFAFPCARLPKYHYRQSCHARHNNDNDGKEQQHLISLTENQILDAALQLLLISKGKRFLRERLCLPWPETAGAAAADASAARDPNLPLRDALSNLEGLDGHPLLAAVAGPGNTEIIAMLLDHGADPNATGFETQTPLHLAAEKNREDIALQLLAHNDMNANIADESGRTALHVAARLGYVGMIEFLLSRPDTNIQN
ncbi:ankyrin repeat-containing domain protein [Apodospora peruviana]|uniref:Ankyrin repeat-containing domain protein n=1 Tax=Apodospora peruviana TaxID=516989 RepID=A0AAE0M3S2_9PEZI|nr:ankyrin repeat-containing domain protein [Apodospora peruviana]